MSYKPYKPKKQRDIYAKHDRKRNAYVDPTISRVKVFGFRSGKSYKMIPAMLYYAFAIFYIGSAIYGEFTVLKFTPVDVVLNIFKYIFISIIAFSPLIFLSDFKYRDKIPFFKKHDAVASFTGMFILFICCTLMAELDLYCMSDTYKKSVIQYEETLKEETEKEEISNKKDKETALENNTEELTTQK